MGTGRRTSRLIVALVVVLVAAGCRPVLVNVPEAGHGVVGTGVSGPAVISDDGRVVAFETSDFLTADDDEGVADVYVRDVGRRRTDLVSRSPGGVQDWCGIRPPHLSGDGRSVAWATCAGYPDVPPPPGTVGTGVVVRDRASGTMEQIGTAEGAGFVAAGFGLLDQDASHVVTWCFPQEPGPPITSACVHDRSTGETTLVSRRADGTLVPGFTVPVSISDDGARVAFTARVDQVVPGAADTRVQLFVRDVRAGTTTPVTIDPSVLAGDVEGRLSGDGTAAVVWQAGAPHHVVHVDLVTGVVRRVDQARCADAGASRAGWASISDDGDVVAFESSVAGLVPNDTNGVSDVFVWRTAAPCRVQRVSVDVRFRQGDGASYWPEVSGDGATVAFVSEASNLARDDMDGVADAFVVRIGPRRR